MAQWAAGGAPLALGAPWWPWRWARGPQSAPLIAAVAALGGIAFAFLGGTGAALALNSRRGGVLIALIVLPLLTAPVVFGGSAIAAFAGGLPWTTGFILLAPIAWRRRPWRPSPWRAPVAAPCREIALARPILARAHALL